MSQPFDRLIVHQLRGLKELELTGLGQVNLLFGGNDSGKTTVLEALSLLNHPIDPETWIRTAVRRDPMFAAGHTRFMTLEPLRWLFPQASDSMDAPYEGTASLSAEGAAPVTTVRARYKEVEGVLTEESRSSLEPPDQEMGDVLLGAEIDLLAMRKEPAQAAPATHQRSFTLWVGDSFQQVSDAESGDLPLKLINPHDHRTNVIFLRDFSEVRRGEFQESVSELLREIDPRITGLEILAPNGAPMLFLQDSVSGPAPLSAFGDGIRRALLMALAIPRLKGGVLLIEELETAIHVSALTKLFRWMLSACKQYNVQLFATTHSLEAVDAILSVDTTPEEDIVGYRLERTEGRSEAKRFSEGMLKRLRYERGLDVR